MTRTEEISFGCLSSLENPNKYVGFIRTIIRLANDNYCVQLKERNTLEDARNFYSMLTEEGFEELKITPNNCKLEGGQNA